MTTATQTESYFQPSHRLWSSAEPSEMSGLKRNNNNEYGQTCKSPPVTFFREPEREESNKETSFVILDPFGTLLLTVS